MNVSECNVACNVCYLCFVNVLECNIACNGCTGTLATECDTCKTGYWENTVSGACEGNCSFLCTVFFTIDKALKVVIGHE